MLITSALSGKSSKTFFFASSMVPTKYASILFAFREAIVFSTVSLSANFSLCHF